MGQAQALPAMRQDCPDLPITNSSAERELWQIPWKNMQGIRPSYMVLALLACCRKAAEPCDRAHDEPCKSRRHGGQGVVTQGLQYAHHTVVLALASTLPGWAGNHQCSASGPPSATQYKCKLGHSLPRMYRLKAWMQRLAPRLHASLCRTAAATDAAQPQSSDLGSRGSLFQPPAYGGHELGILCGGSPRLVPPMQQCVLILMNSPMAWVAFSVCCASSRVGDRIRTWGLYKA